MAAKKQGRWPDDCIQRAFVAGAEWWEYEREGATMWASDRAKAEVEAVRRFGEPAQPHITCQHCSATFPETAMYWHHCHHIPQCLAWSRERWQLSPQRTPHTRAPARSVAHPHQRGTQNGQNCVKPTGRSS